MGQSKTYASIPVNRELSSADRSVNPGRPGTVGERVKINLLIPISNMDFQEAHDLLVEKKKRRLSNIFAENLSF